MPIYDRTQEHRRCGGEMIVRGSDHRCSDPGEASRLSVELTFEKVVPTDEGVVLDPVE